MSVSILVFIASGLVVLVLTWLLGLCLENLTTRFVTTDASTARKPTAMRYEAFVVVACLMAVGVRLAGPVWLDSAASKTSAETALQSSTSATTTDTPATREGGGQ